MAKFKGTVRFQRSDGFYNVYIRITHKRKVAYMKTDKTVSSKGIDKNNTITDPFVLKYCVAKINIYTELLNKIDCDNWELPQIIEYLESGSADVSFTDYAEKYIDELINKGQERNAKNYSLAVRSLKIYAGSKNVMFSHLTSYFINGWIKSLSHTARAKEMYPVCVRQIFKAAIQEYNDYDLGVIRITTNPWVKVQIPNSDTPEKKAITMEDCRNFFFCELPQTDRIHPLPEIARDITMMTLCLAGINTIDLYRLKKSDYRDGIICYERSKTRKAREDNAYIEMRVPSILDPIFEKYRNHKDTEYLFNFHERYSSSDSFNADINKGIKDICIKSLGMVKGKDRLYSPYTFRHTWATVAQNECGASISEVGFALNHSQKTVTKKYIKMDFSPAWELNEKVVEKIFFTEDKSNQREKSEGENFERFSFKQLIRGTLYFRGRVIHQIEDIGFNNVNEVIDLLMKKIPDNVPSGCMVQIRIENLDKQQKKDYTRIIS